MTRFAFIFLLACFSLPCNSHSEERTLKPAVDGERVKLISTFRMRGSMLETEQPRTPPTRSRHTYLCEVLVRGDDGHLFLACDVLPNRSGEFALLGYDRDGALAEPPDSGYATLRRQRSVMASLIPGKNLGSLVVRATGCKRTRNVVLH
jgi:hypothetical protein